MAHTLTPTARRVALHTLRALRTRDTEYWERRAEQSRRAIRDRDWDWQNYCNHGSYVGDPYGADYMCYLCEGGLSIYDEALATAHAAVREWEAIIDLLPALQRAQRFGAIESADIALAAAITAWQARYLPELAA